jgi:hypothetical protein
MIRFTIRPCQSFKRKARDSNPHLQWRAALAVQSGQPYPATFHIEVDSPGIEPGLPPCHSGVFPSDYEPLLC